MSDAIRILRVADVPNNRMGGMSRAMHLTSDFMSGWGHAVEYLWADDMPETKAQLRRFTTPLFVRRFVRERTRAGTGWDVVEVHEPSGAPLIHARRGDKRLPPVVAYSHGIEARHHRAELEYRRKAGMYISWKARYSPLSVIWQAEYALQWATHRLVTNTEDKAYIKEKWGVPDAAVSVVETGIIGSYLEAGAALPEQAERHKRILFLGSWILRKGTREITAVMNRLLAERSDCVFTVAGCGAQESAVRGAFDGTVQSRLYVLPKITGEANLQALYADHGIFLLPSFFEGQPLVMVEAGALHCALVMTDTCGMKDFLENGKVGVGVPVGDADAIYRALVSLVDNPAQARIFGQAAYRKARTQTWEKAAQTKITAYRTAIEAT